MDLNKLLEQRAALLVEVGKLKKADGTFADDGARTAFDAKIAEVEALDVKIGEARAAATNQPAPSAATRTPDEILAAERGRCEGITNAVRIARLDSSIALAMIKRGISLDVARGELLDQLAARSGSEGVSGRIEIGEDARDKQMRGMTNALLVRGGAAPMVAKASKADVATIEPGEFRGFSLLDMARFCLEQAGRATRGMDRMRMVSEAFTLRSTSSTSDFTTLLENVMNKILLAAYAIQPDTWTRFCYQSTVPDFRATNRYRMGTFGSLDALNENGEFKNKQITDAEKATITASTKGNIINVSRQMIVNDDMGAFTRLFSMLGRAAKLSVEVDVFALLAQNSGDGPTLTDGHALFDNTYHLNKPTGAALSAAALDLDRVAMAKQTDKDGNDYLDVRPAILLLAVGLGGQARVINDSLYNPDDVATGSKATMKPNLVNGLFRDIVDTPRITGTRRYMFADPNIIPTLEVAFLEGYAEPVLETKDGWQTDGAEMRIRYDYGVAAVDYRGAITNAGV